MNIAITGATGYIGSNLVKKFTSKYKLILLVRENGINVDSSKNIEVRITNFNSPSSIGKSLKDVDVIYHLAGALPNLNLSNEQYLDTNGYLARRVYTAASKIDSVKQFILCSTAFITWNGKIQSDENTKPCPSTIYERSKLLGETLTKSEAIKSKLPLTIVRPGFVYGNHGLGLLNLSRTIKSNKFFFVGKGDQLFELININDLIRFFIKILNNPKSFDETFIVSSRHPLTFKKIVDIISDALKVPRPKIHVPTLLFKITVFPLIQLAKIAHLPFPISIETFKTLTTPRSFNIKKARRILNFSDRLNHRIAIKKLISWYKQESLV